MSFTSTREVKVAELQKNRCGDDAQLLGQVEKVKSAAGYRGADVLQEGSLAKAG